jgi:hypothetical protein
MFIFGFVLTVIGTLLHAYVFWRASSVPFLRRRLRPRTMALIALVAWAFFVVARTIGHGAAGTIVSLFELLAMTWMGALFLTAVCLAATEIVTAFGFLFSRYAPMLRGWALVAGGALSAIAIVQALRPPVVRSYEVNVAGLPAELDGTVLVAMSDLHLNSPLTSNWLENRVAQVQALHPDLIVLLGDIFEGHGPPKDELVAAMNRLSAPLGVWAVPGNHEHYGARGGASQSAAQSGFQMLRNRWVELQPGLTLAGVEDLTIARRRGRGSAMVEQALANRPPGATILLSHTLANGTRSKTRRRTDALRPYPRRPDLALRLPGPHALPTPGRPLRSERNASPRLPRNRNLGTLHAALASRRDPVGDVARADRLIRCSFGVSHLATS